MSSDTETGRGFKQKKIKEVANNEAFVVHFADDDEDRKRTDISHLTEVGTKIFLLKRKVSQNFHIFLYFHLLIISKYDNKTL